MTGSGAYGLKRARRTETNGESNCPACRNLRRYKLTRGHWFKCLANGAKGKAALQVVCELGVRTKTAWLNFMKLREALAARRGEVLLDGQVEIDGMYLAEPYPSRGQQEPTQNSVTAARGRHGRPGAPLVWTDVGPRCPEREF